MRKSICSSANNNVSETTDNAIRTPTPTRLCNNQQPPQRNTSVPSKKRNVLGEPVAHHLRADHIQG